MALVCFIHSARLHGTRCAETAALHVALGDRLALDVGNIACYPSAQVGRVCVCVSACNNSFVFVCVYMCVPLSGVTVWRWMWGTLRAIPRRR